MSNALKTHKFARKTFYVDAVRVSENNMEAVAEWCGGEIVTDHEDGAHVKVKVHRPITERQTMAFIGDWVLWAGNGFKVYTPKAFDKSFEKVRTLTKEQADAAGIKVPHEKRQPKKLSKPEADAAGIKVPREPSQPPVPAPPKVITEATIQSVSVDKDPGPYENEFREKEKPKEKDEVDKLFDEVMRTKR